MKLIVGLGNPGKEYANTRHNAGVWWLQALCSIKSASLQAVNKFYGLATKIINNEQQIILFIPTTFMNLSGKAVASITNYYNITPKEILIVHDDLDLNAGKIKLKYSGGHGGHNGLRDIISALQSNNFYRLRIGIDHPGDKDKVTDYVLQKPSKVDKNIIENNIEKSLNLLADIISGNIQDFNNKIGN